MTGSPIYTTGDEKRWLYSLARRGRIDDLRRLLPVYELRDWSGAGMAVDGEQVLATLRWLLAGGRAR